MDRSAWHAAPRSSRPGAAVGCEVFFIRQKTKRKKGCAITAVLFYVLDQRSLNESGQHGERLSKMLNGSSRGAVRLQIASTSRHGRNAPAVRRPRICSDKEISGRRCLPPLPAARWTNYIRVTWRILAKHLMWLHTVSTEYELVTLKCLYDSNKNYYH